MIVEFDQIEGKINFEQVKVRNQSKIAQIMIAASVNMVIFDIQDRFGKSANTKRCIGQDGKDARICQCKNERQEIIAPKRKKDSKFASQTCRRAHGISSRLVLPFERDAACSSCERVT